MALLMLRLLLGNTVLETIEHLSRHLHPKPKRLVNCAPYPIAETCHFSGDETIPSPTDSTTTELDVTRMAKMDAVADTCRDRNIGMYF